MDTTAIIGGAVGGAGALVIGSVIFALIRSRRAHKAKELSLEDLAKLSAAQQQQAQMEAQQMMQSYPSQQKITQQDVVMMVQQAQQYGVIPPATGASGPVSSIGGSSGSMTPYQQQYMMQQQQMMMQPGMMVPSMNLMAAAPPGMGPSFGVPSINVQQMANNQMSLSRSEIPVQAIQLVLKYDFVGERDDELTCKKDDIIYGVEENDGWWLAKSNEGKIGLVPSSYVAVNDIKIGGNINF